MIGTDWLRRKAAATVRIGEARPAEVTLTIDNRDGAFTTRGELVPTGIVRIERDLTEAEVAQIRERFETAVMPTAAADDPLRCTCAVIYSRCYCGH